METETWEKLYISRLISWGLSEEEAEENFKAVPVDDQDDDPETYADDEVSYMMADS